MVSLLFVLLTTSFQGKDWKLDDGLLRIPTTLFAKFKVVFEGTPSDETDRLSRSIYYADQASHDAISIDIERLKRSGGLDEHGKNVVKSGVVYPKPNAFSGLPIGKFSGHRDDVSLSITLPWEAISFTNGWGCTVSYTPAFVDGPEGRVRTVPSDGHEAERVEGIARVLMGRMLAKDSKPSSPLTVHNRVFAEPRVAPNGTILLNLSDWTESIGAKAKVNLDMTIQISKGGKTVTTGLACSKAKVGKSALADLEDYSIMIGDDIYVPYISLENIIGI